MKVAVGQVWHLKRNNSVWVIMKTDHDFACWHYLGRKGEPAALTPTQAMERGTRAGYFHRAGYFQARILQDCEFLGWAEGYGPKKHDPGAMLLMLTAALAGRLRRRTR